MNVLAFDTSTDVLSLALGCGLGGSAPRTWVHTSAGGAQASASLIPAAQALMAQAGLAWPQLQAIAFGRGPGSFTGLRTACSVAQGLAFGAGVPVLPIDTLLAVAEEARSQRDTPEAALQVAALLDARMDELYVGYYSFHSGMWTQHGGYSLVSPEDVAVPAGHVLAGNAFAAYGARLCLPAGEPPACLHALPTASAMLRLATQLLALGQAVPAQEALPLYIRDKVAQTTQERADLKAARLPAP